MAESIFTPHIDSPVDPELRHTTNEPKGVLQKNLKTFVYLGAALLVIVAAIMSSAGKKTPAQQAAAKGQPPQPTLQDNTDNNVQDLKKPHRPMGPPALRCLAFRAKVFRGSHVSKCNKATRSSLRRYRNKHSRLPRRNEPVPTTRVSHRTLHTLVLVSSRSHKG